MMDGGAESSASSTAAGVLPAADVWETEAGLEALSLHTRPTVAWDAIAAVSPHQKVKPLLDPSTPCPDNHTRFVCLSDTHGTVGSFKFEVPWGHVLLHAGDFTDRGQQHHVKEFNAYLKTLPHEHKIVIAGNHDLPFDAEQWEKFRDDPCVTEDAPDLKGADGAAIKALLVDCTYLEDQEITIRGFRIFGTPWQPKFHEAGAFTLSRGKRLAAKWRKIPSGIDILLSHSPPVGHGDLSSGRTRAGCVDLLREVQTRVKPQYHVFGHIHEAHGMTTDGTTRYVNACVCDLRFQPNFQPIVFDLPNPQ